MTNAFRSELMSLIICIVLSLMLIFLFVFPRKYLNNFLDDINSYALNTRDGVMEDNKEKTKLNTEKMVLLFEDSSNLLKLFLNHEDVDELEVFINSCYYTCRTDKTDFHVMIDNVENILKKCEYLFDVETLSLYNLF